MKVYMPRLLYRSQSQPFRSSVEGIAAHLALPPYLLWLRRLHVVFRAKMQNIIYPLNVQASKKLESVDTVTFLDRASRYLCVVRRFELIGSNSRRF